MKFIKENLNNIRKPNNQTMTKNILFVVLSLLLGITLGMFSKWLDNLSLDSTIWWHNIVSYFDLGNFFSDMAIWLLIALIIAVLSASALTAAMNVFVFFSGMCLSYHLYTILFSGFNPSSYMMIWYGITLISPLLAILCWYAKGEGIVALILDIGIIATFTISCFAVGLIYIDLKGILYSIVFSIALITLYRSPRQLIIALLLGILLAFPLSSFLLF